MHLKPKKSLGQNFLVDQNIQRKIITTCGLKPSDVVLEIGAGRGELTRLILGQVKKVYALEIDVDLCKTLKDKFKEFPNIKIINRDILEFNLSRYFQGFKQKIKVIGNIPYYITTPILQHLLKYHDKIEAIFITVQKEFASRIIAHPGSKEYGSFSCFMQYYTQPKILFPIKKTCFLPSPKVDSCFLRLEMRNRPLFKAKNERLLFRIIRRAFRQRRKTLKNGLKDMVAQEELESFFRNYQIDPQIRPEDLSLKDFINLANI